MRVPSSTLGRLALVVPGLLVVGFLLWWRGPDWSQVGDAFRLVEWMWVSMALGLNLLSVLIRAVSWQTVIKQALLPPTPSFPYVFSAFSVGLLANAVLPGRIGELARVAVLARRVPRDQGVTGRLLGTVFAHRLFDVVPALLLTAFVLATARIPRWAVTSIEIVAVIGVALFLLAILVAGRELRPLPESALAIRRLLAMAQRGLHVMREPKAALLAALLQHVLEPPEGIRIHQRPVLAPAFDVVAALHVVDAAEVAPVGATALELGRRDRGREDRVG